MNITVTVNKRSLYQDTTTLHFQLYPNAYANGLQGHSPHNQVSVNVGFDRCDNCGAFKQDVHRVVGEAPEEFYDLCHKCEAELSDPESIPMRTF